MDGKDGHDIRSHTVGQMTLCARHRKANALQRTTRHTTHLWEHAGTGLI